MALNRIKACQYD